MEGILDYFLNRGETSTEKLDRLITDIEQRMDRIEQKLAHSDYVPLDLQEGVEDEDEDEEDLQELWNQRDEIRAQIAASRVLLF